VALKGQLLERSVIVPVGSACMDGIYLRGSGVPLLLASPLPGWGGSMATPVLNELAYAAAHAKCSSLRLNYTGVGASEGDPPGSVGEAAEQLAQGVSFLTESADRAQVGVGGYLTGCFAALELARRDRRVDRVLLVAPTWEQIPEATLAGVACPILVVAASDEPGFDLALEEARVADARSARLEVLPLTRAFRRGLPSVARLVPPFLGADPPHADEIRPRVRLF
jgi:alpha/beta superfamily hydrolase